MDGLNTFIRLYMKDMYSPVEQKVKKLTKNIVEQFKLYNIRGFNIERKKENFYIYMKNLAFKNYRKEHLIQIFRKYHKNILEKKEINKIKRTRSHKIPYHKMTYHTIIYRNLYNYKYRPYLLPLTKDDNSDKIFLNLTDNKMKRKFKKRHVFVNPHLELRRKNLIKVNEQLKEKEKLKIFKKIKILQKAKSNPSLINNVNYKNNLIQSWNNQRTRIPGKLHNMRNEKNIFNYMNNNNISNCGESTTNYKSLILKSSEKKKGKQLILPKIARECVSTINSLNKIKNRLKFFKEGSKENKVKEEININNIHNLNLHQLYKLFFINNNKNKNLFKMFKKKENISKDNQSRHSNLRIIIGSDSNRNNKEANN